jgi:hypothetical protein
VVCWSQCLTVVVLKIECGSVVDVRSLCWPEMEGAQGWGKEYYIQLLSAGRFIFNYYLTA